MLLIDLLLLRFIRRSFYTPLWHFLLIAEQGLLAAPIFALIISRVIEGTPNSNLAAHGLAWHGTFFLLASAFLMYRQKRKNGKSRRCTPSLILVTGILYGALAVDALLIEPTALVIKETTIASPKISQPVTIVFCSDLQTDQVGNYERRTLQKIKEQNADLVLFGGDYVQFGNEEMDMQLLKDWNQLFKEINLNPPLGIYAVQGNKDYFIPWQEMFTDTAIVPFETTVNLQVNEEIRMTLLSVRRSLTARLVPDAGQKDQFRIIVGHVPVFAMGNQDADLLLAGHTHGGQVQIPFFGPLITNSGALPRKWASGKTYLPGGATLIVSHGTGLQRQPAPVIRLFCRPDFWVIRLVPEKTASDK